MEKEELLKLYSVLKEEEHYFLSQHQKCVAFYAGLISALIAGTVAALIKSDQWYYTALVGTGPISIVAVALLAKRGTVRFYLSFLETITVLSKIESELGLAKPRNQAPDQPVNWIENEPFVTKRHMDSRTDSDYKTSKEWVNGHLKIKTNYNCITLKLFSCVSYLGWILFGLTLIIAFGKFVKQEPTSLLQWLDKLCELR